MRVIVSLVAAIAVVLTWSGAFAQALDEDTKCGVIEKISNDPSANPQRVRDVAQYILQTMQAVDRAHGAEGKPAIFSQMTEEGQSLLAIVAMKRCRGRSEVAVADIAIETYEAIRTIRGALGYDEPRKLTRRFLIRARSHPRQEVRSARRRTQNRL